MINQEKPLYYCDIFSFQGLHREIEIFNGDRTLLNTGVLSLLREELNSRVLKRRRIP